MLFRSAEVTEAGRFAVIGAKADTAVEGKIIVVVINSEGSLLLGYRARATIGILAWPG